ncbi:MAG: tyrosine-type recombinase/integrase [Firmicutes bacterium]|jgi:integrase/recombinase XerC|nr:tyrosine-type recombinase/integrase [Bacillota bacterium]
MELGEYAAALEARRMSDATIRGYLSDLGLFSRWLEETTGTVLRPGSLTAADVREYVSYLNTVQRMKPASVSRRIRALANYCEWLVQTGSLPNNPVKGIRLPTEAKRPPRSLGANEVYRLRRAVHGGHNARDIAIVELMLSAGLRVSEVCSLTLRDVFISERKGRVVVHSGKGERYREVPLNSVSRQALRDYLSVRPGGQDEIVFLGARGPLTPSGVWRIMQKYCEEAKIQASPHVLRHTFATRLLRENHADLVVVKELLGHKSLDTTAVYTMPTLDDMEVAVEGGSRKAG